MAVLIIAIGYAFYVMFSVPSDYGYYHYQDAYYYKTADGWYLYDDEIGWSHTYVDDELDENKESHYQGDYNDGYVEEGFYSSTSDNDWVDDWDDDDWDWDSDSDWDSGDTDWDSDW